MEHQILDAEVTIAKKRKPASVWLTGLLCGTVAAIILCLSFYGVLPFVIPFLLPMILFGSIAQIYIAAFGSREGHLSSIWSVAMIVNVITAFGEIIFYVMFDIEADFMAIFIMLFGFSFINFVTALIFWLFQGKLPYFRNQVAE